MPKPIDQLVPLDAPSVPQGGLSLFGRSGAEISAILSQFGESPYRGFQIAEAIYKQKVTDISLISTLPGALRQRLAAEAWQVGRPRISQVFQSVDGTERYLIQCPNSSRSGSEGKGDKPMVAVPETVETVWMPEGDDGEVGDESDSETAKSSWSRATICVSSQIGCAVNCQFCLTAKLGLQRNLTAGEIAGQVVEVLDRHNVEVGRDRLNLVFMGMGEPLLNYDNFMAAVRLLVEEVELSPQRMTVSTSGIVPGIERFAEEPSAFRPKLAISLNAPNNDVRAEIMPINRKWTIEAVVDAVRHIKLRPRERVTFEYVLLAGVTDRPEHAREVARLVRGTGLPVKVNLIAWNPGPGISYSMPTPERVEAFRASLIKERIPAYVRKPRGRDIFAACGQLKQTAGATE